MSNIEKKFPLDNKWTKLFGCLTLLGAYNLFGWTNRSIQPHH